MGRKRKGRDLRKRRSEEKVTPLSGVLPLALSSARLKTLKNEIGACTTGWCHVQHVETYYLGNEENSTVLFYIVKHVGEWPEHQTSVGKS